MELSLINTQSSASVCKYFALSFIKTIFVLIPLVIKIDIKIADKKISAERFRFMFKMRKASRRTLKRAQIVITDGNVAEVYIKLGFDVISANSLIRSAKTVTSGPSGIIPPKSKRIIPVYINAVIIGVNTNVEIIDNREILSKLNTVTKSVAPTANIDVRKRFKKCISILRFLVNPSL